MILYEEWFLAIAKPPSNALRAALKTEVRAVVRSASQRTNIIISDARHKQAQENTP
jgi:hypothetical protein